MPSPSFTVKCPGCQTKFSIPGTSAGQTIACPQCQKAMRIPASLGARPPEPGTAAGPPPLPAPRPAAPLPPPIPELEDDLFDQPAEPKPSRSLSRRRRDEEDDDDRDQDRDDDRVDDDYDDRPRRRRRKRLEAHRGGMILAFGVMALCAIIFLPLIVFGPIAWVMGKSDLAAIQDGKMDPEGQSSTQAGYVMGIIATCLYGVLMVLGCLCWVGIIISIANNPNHH
jgi:hypothetical protein